MVVNHLVELMEEYGLDSASVSDGSLRVGFKRTREQLIVPQFAGSVAPVPEGSATESEGEDEVELEDEVPSGVAIVSPMTGIFYSGSSPGAAPFVTIGDSVDEGQVIGLIEAMKVFNEITATASGKVVAVLVEDGALVQSEDVLLRVSSEA